MSEQGWLVRERFEEQREKGETEEPKTKQREISKVSWYVQKMNVKMGPLLCIHIQKMKSQK